MKLKDALELMKEPKELSYRAAELDKYVSIWTSDMLVSDFLHEAEKRLGLHDRSNTALRAKWVNCLHDLVGAQPGCPVNKAGLPTVSDIDVLLCSTLIRCAAYVMTAEWKEARK